MKTVLQGELPAGITDHGVFEGLDNSQSNIEELKAKKARADEQLAALFAKVQNGTIGAEEFASIQELSAKAIHLAKDLEAAQTAEAEAEQCRLRNADAELRTNLEAVLANAAQCKKEFIAAYKAACLALGSFCSAVDEASQIEASRARFRNFGLLDPDRTLASSRIATLNADLDPLPALRLAGLHGTMQFGWNSSFPVVPLHETRKEKP